MFGWAGRAELGTSTAHRWTLAAELLGVGDGEIFLEARGGDRLVIHFAVFGVAEIVPPGVAELCDPRLILRRAEEPDVSSEF